MIVYWWICTDPSSVLASQHSIILNMPLNDSDDSIDLHTMDARKLPNPDWNERFDAVIEKGALDAIYLSGDGNVERAVAELGRVLKPGGIFLSISGVVPPELRKELFQEWEWIKDGSDELQAGCFVLKKPKPE